MTSLDTLFADYAPRIDTFIHFEAHNAGTLLTKPANGLYVGGAGNVNLVGLDGVPVLFPSVPAGTTLRVAHLGVATPNTSASGFVALY